MAAVVITYNSFENYVKILLKMKLVHYLKDLVDIFHLPRISGNPSAAAHDRQDWRS